jgi:adenylate cyclase
MLRARRKPPGNLDAYDHYLRGLAEIPPNTREDVNRLWQHISKATELDPEFAPASGLAAWCCAVRKGFGWWSDTEGELTEARRLAQAAARLGQDDAVVLCQAGYVFAYVLHDLRAGRNIVDQALGLNPNVALAWASSGLMHLWGGEPSLAFEHFHRAMRLNPLDIAAAHVQNGMAHALFFLDRYDEACSWASKVLQSRPALLGGLRIAAASAALGGEDALAHQMGARILALFPGFRVSNLKDHLGPYQNPDLPAKYAAGLRLAGLP